MTINNPHGPNGYLDNLWDWSFLKPCFGGTKIEVSDGDGLVERNGSILWLETKAPGVEVKRGQAIMFDAFSQKPGCYVLVIWGKPGAPVAMQLWGHDRQPVPASIELLQKRVSRWFAMADRLPRRNAS